MKAGRGGLIFKLEVLQDMRKKRPIFFALGLMLILLFALTAGAATIFTYSGAKGPRPGTRAPIITHTFAVEKGYTGYIWKIYIEAEDPDGDMRWIASVVDEPGYSSYPTDWIILKPEKGKHFRGYIQWNTSSGLGYYMPEWTIITLKVSVFDRAGNESNEVIFPFTFELTRAQYEYKLPAPFDQGDIPRLGHITIDLYPPGGGGTSGPAR